MWEGERVSVGESEFGGERECGREGVGDRGRVGVGERERVSVGERGSGRGCGR